MRRKTEETNLKFILGCETPLFDVVRKAADRVLCATHTLDLLTSSVCCSGVRHSNLDNIMINETIKPSESY